MIFVLSCSRKPTACPYCLTAHIDASVQLGVRKIFLETVVVNSGAREFYRKVQFQLSGLT